MEKIDHLVERLQTHLVNIREWDERKKKLELEIVKLYGKIKIHKSEAQNYIRSIQQHKELLDAQESG